MLALAIGNRGYTDKTHLRGFKTLDSSLVRVGGLRLYSREFYSPKIFKTFPELLMFCPRITDLNEPHSTQRICWQSVGERDFPPAFKRRCLRVRMPDPTKEALKAIVEAHFKEASFDEQAKSKIEDIIGEFMKKDSNQSQERATDQLLNTIYVLTREDKPLEKDEESIKEILLRSLTSSD
ncbi:hypothetical protein WA1_16815 [Scytonema hofmannii PCC 7110]|uniref:Uncharacterized protein n=2 Tax=Scytonema hofmannii TaxID=34078 RepID=A0A139XAI8_9CYAN|nr:hypothetical protein WA1_16815 [Scytonema hofmannii PCC 7110]